jgi:GT2 family glycosyltransferase
LIEAKPTVATIVLNWNGKEVIGDCLRSLLANDYPNLQVTVVDNGSVDGSVDYLKTEFPTVGLVCSPTNLGFTGGNNLGMRQALEEGADYIWLLNNDTVVDRECVSHLVRVAEGDAQYGALSPKIYYFDPPDRLWYAGGAFSLWKGVSEHWGRKAVDEGQYDALREVTFVNGCALFVRASVLREVGLLDETLFSCAEDADLSVRIRQAGYRLAYVPAARLWHKEGIDTLKNKGQAYRSYLYVRNSLWVLTKHAHPIQLLLAYPYFAVNGILRLTLLALLERDIRAAAAPLRAVWGFLKMVLIRDRRAATDHVAPMEA